MSRLILGNLQPGTSDDEIRELLDKYGFPAIEEIEHIDEDGAHPAVLLTFPGSSTSQLTQLQQRIHDLYWKERKLTARVLTDRFE